MSASNEVVKVLALAPVALLPAILALFPPRRRYALTIVVANLLGAAGLYLTSEPAWLFKVPWPYGIASAQVMLAIWVLWSFLLMMALRGGAVSSAADNRAGGRSGATPAPVPLRLYRRTFFDGIYLVFAAVLTPLSVFCGYYLSFAVGNAIAIGLTIASFLIWSGVLINLVKGFTWKGPMLTLDSSGITDHWRGQRAIPWQHIQEARIIIYSRHCLEICLRKEARSSLPWHTRFLFWPRLADMFGGGDVSIYMGNIPYDKKTLESTIAGYLQAQVPHVGPAAVR